MNYYLLFKSLHLIAVISWMAGLLYLPRIFVYHVENYQKKETTEIFETMERKLYFYIMRPAMLISWLFGILLIYQIGFESFSQLWLQLKIFFVIILTVYHEYLGKCLTVPKSISRRTARASPLQNPTLPSFATSWRNRPSRRRPRAGLKPCIWSRASRSPPARRRPPFSTWTS